MNNTTFPELAALRIEMSEEVRDEQFRAIVAHLNEPVQESLGLVTKARAAWRRWVVVVAAVGTALVPVAAVASEAAAPGDLLYPVKLTVERIQLIFNDDAAAEHRVDELETLVDRSVDAVVIDRHLTTTARRHRRNHRSNRSDNPSFRRRHSISRNRPNSRGDRRFGHHGRSTGRVGQRWRDNNGPDDLDRRRQGRSGLGNGPGPDNHPAGRNNHHHRSAFRLRRRRCWV